MALYLTGDTHGNFRRLLPEAFYEQETMTKENIVLVCVETLEGCGTETSGITMA